MRLLDLNLEVLVLHLQFPQLLLEILRLHLDGMFFVFKLAFELTRHLILNQLDFVFLLDFHVFDVLHIVFYFQLGLLGHHFMQLYVLLKKCNFLGALAAGPHRLGLFNFLEVLGVGRHFLVKLGVEDLILVSDLFVLTFLERQLLIQFFNLQIFVVVVLVHFLVHLEEVLRELCRVASRFDIIICHTLLSLFFPHLLLRHPAVIKLKLQVFESDMS